VQDPLPVWVAVGGNPHSVIRAGVLGLPMALAIIGGLPERFVGLAELHREAAKRSGHGPLPLSLNMHGFVAGSSRAAADLYYPAHSAVMNRIGAERGWGPTDRAAFDAQIGPRGPYVVGSPQQVVEKILFLHEVFGHDRMMIQPAIGDVGHRDVMRAIELLGTEVAPAVRAATTARAETATPA
jgi:alkanesulfonate monooxygenase SsuD/methylene tetrahydromethanopterin reductase-like flavin-dependent oxidoreductase (luciferase family)